MRKQILVISGFTENNYENTGSLDLYSKLWKYAEMGAHDSETFIALKEWNYDWKAFAKFLNAVGVKSAIVACYSWGAGFGLREFAKYFDGEISAVLCDPVYRSKFPWMRWRAVLSVWRPTIKYPRNVTVKAWFYQTINEPGADDVFTHAPLPKPIKLNVKHSEIDNHEAYHEAVIREVERFTNA